MAVLLLRLPSCHRNRSPTPLVRTSPSNQFSLSFLPGSLPVPHSRSHAAAAAVVTDVDGGGPTNGGRGGGGGGCFGGGGWWGGDDEHGNDHDDGGRGGKVAVASILSLLCCFRLSSLALARTAPPDSQDKSYLSVWEVKGGKWNSLVPDDADDAFLTDRGILASPSLSPFMLFSRRGFQNCLRLCWGGFLRLMLPEGFPNSVTSDYLDYSLWRAVQNVASQISGVLSTQALLFAVGLGKGAIPTAAAISWVLKDGIGYLSKIMLSKFGRHFDVHPKGWRLFADLLEDAAFGLEILTPAFPHLFVLIGAVAGAGRSAATLIQAATRSCFYAGFAAQRNFAEVSAKGEAQGMVSKFIGIALGIALANYVSRSTVLALATFGIVSGFHMYCNLKSYQSIQLRTLNPYRASLVFSEYLLSGEVPSVKEVNNEEPLFPVLPAVDVSFSSKEGSETLSPAAKYAAFEISGRLQLGCRLSEIVSSKEDALALFDLFKDDGYMLAEKQGKFCVILKEGSSPEDMLKAVFHVNYLHWLEANVAWLERRSIHEECSPGGSLHISLDYASREFDHVKSDGEQAGWMTDGLIARPSPYRIRAGYD